MAVTYEQARDIVRKHYDGRWTHGTFCLDDRQIVETDEFYVFDVGAREWLVDGDESYEVAGGMDIVYKNDGRLTSLSSAVVATDPTVRCTANPNPTLKWP
jgi:hypothetical protein